MNLINHHPVSFIICVSLCALIGFVEISVFFQKNEGEGEGGEQPFTLSKKSYIMRFNHILFP